MADTLSDPIAVRMPTEVLTALDEIASILDRKRSWVIVRALKGYLAGEGQYLIDLAIARREAAAGDLVDAGDLLGELAGDLPLFGTLRR